MHRPSWPRSSRSGWSSGCIRIVQCSGAGNAVKLNDDEQAMLAGERGEAVRRAIELQIKVGDFFEAADFVPIDSAHMMAEIESMGEPCLAWVEEMADLGG